MNKQKLKLWISLYTLAIVLVASISLGAQTTSFNYQGHLNNGGTAANGNFDFEFALYDALTSGAQLGSTIALNNIAVTSGTFSVSLDFGNQFPGTNRFLEIRIRQSGQSGITTLAPRQLLNSAPYSVKTLNADNATTAATAANATNAANATSASNALNLGGVAANQYVQTNDARLTDSRPPTPGSSSYIQNNPASVQSGSFNIGGNGMIGGNLTVGGSFSLNIINAQTQYNLGGSRVLSNPGTNNLFAGVGAGGSNTTGCCSTFVGFHAGAVSNTNDNSFFGNNAGASTTGARNSFFGSAAGLANTTGVGGSFFGTGAGQSNTSGNNNSFFGDSAGGSNTTGISNSFFGASAGFRNTSGASNSFFGFNTGAANTADENSFFGAGAGRVNTSGGQNTFLGKDAGFANTEAGGNTFVGFDAGKSNGTNDTTNRANSNTFIGISAGFSNTLGQNNTFVGGTAGVANTSGDYNTFIGRGNGQFHTTGSFVTLIGAGADVGSPNLDHSTAIGAGATVSAVNTVVLGRDTDRVVVPGTTTLGTVSGTGVAIQLTVVGKTQIGYSSPTEPMLTVASIPPRPSSASVCFNSSGDLLQCGASSLRFKSHVEPFRDGLGVIRRLRPISFDWKDGSGHDVGLAAEDVARVAPSFTFTDKNGDVAGVKYERLNILLINAVKGQQEMIERQRRQIEALTKLVCATKLHAKACQGQRK